MHLMLAVSVVWNALVFALTPAVMPFFDVEPETRRLTVWLVLIHNLFNCTGDVPGLVHTGSHILCPLQKR